MKLGPYHKSKTNLFRCQYNKLHTEYDRYCFTITPNYRIQSYFEIYQCKTVFDFYLFKDKNMMQIQLKIAFLDHAYTTQVLPQLNIQSFHHNSFQ